MAADNNKNSNSNNDIRKVTQDSQNTSVNSGRKPEPATIHFTFDNRPAESSNIGSRETHYGLPPDYDYGRSNEKNKSVETEEASGGSGGGSVSVMLSRFAKTVNNRIEEAKKARAAEAKKSQELARQRTDEERKKQLAEAVVRYNRKKASAPEADGAAVSSNAELEAKAAAIEAEREHNKAVVSAAMAKEAEEKARAAEEAEARRRAEELARQAEAEARAKEKAKKQAEREERRVAAQKARAAAAERRAAQKKVRDEELAKQKAAADAAYAARKAEADKKRAEEKEAAEKRKAEARAAKAEAKAAKEKAPKPVKKHRAFWGFVKIVVTLVIVTVIAGGGYTAYIVTHAPEIHPDKIYSMLDVSTHIYDDKGKLIDEIYYTENREVVKYEEIPDNLKNAFIAIEDKTFWTHKGFNIRRIFGAIWNSVTGGGEISGTSTITQQLARNVFLPEEKSIRSIKRKIIEMYYAYEIEEVLSKEEILTAYLNTIYLGYGCYGVETAANKYFSSSIEDLSLAQCAALAALPQAPGVYQLIVTENDKAETTTKIKKGLYANDISRERRYLVLDLMAEQGFITEKKAKKAKKPLEEFIKPGQQFSGANSAFKDYLLETVIADLRTQYDLTEEQATKLVYTKGLEIYSTLNTQAQNVITKEFKNGDNFPSASKSDSKVEAAMVITEIGTGKIKAMVGGRKYKGEKLFNRANSPRQPGSSIKPIAVYGPALQKSFEYQQKGQLFPFKNTGYDRQGTTGWGNYITTLSTVTDERMTVNGREWPQNFGRTFTGYKNFRTAIQQSINTCSVKILAQIGTDYSIDMVKKFGITTAIDDTDEPYNDVNLAALGLGAMTEGVTPLEMSLAYATFPNGGVHNSGICYTKVTDSEGKVLLEGDSEETRVLDEGVAYIMTDVLQTVVSNGIAYDAAISGERVGGKTGTTDETWDIWFDGFTANYAAALWIGTDDNTPLAYGTTSGTAARLWSTIMSQVKKAKGGTYKSIPSNVILKNGDYFTIGTQPPDPPKPVYSSKNSKSSKKKKN